MIGTLARDRLGVAAVEFALTCPLLLIVIGGLTDFPMAFWTRGAIETGVADGATYAFQQMQAALAQNQPVSTSNISAVVQSSINLANVSVQVTPPYLACVSVNQTTTPPIATLVAAQAGATCPNRSLPGTYITISASYTFTPMLPFYSWMANTTMAETANVRVY
jgi:Flp pilus assembly protein TadG